MVFCPTVWNLGPGRKGLRDLVLSVLPPVGTFFALGPLFFSKTTYVIMSSCVFGLDINERKRKLVI